MMPQSFPPIDINLVMFSKWDIEIYTKLQEFSLVHCLPCVFDIFKVHFSTLEYMLPAVELKYLL